MPSGGGYHRIDMASAMGKGAASVGKGAASVGNSVGKGAASAGGRAAAAGRHASAAGKSAAREQQQHSPPPSVGEAPEPLPQDLMTIASELPVMQEIVMAPAGDMAANYKYIAYAWMRKRTVSFLAIVSVFLWLVGTVAWMPAADGYDRTHPGHALWTAGNFIVDPGNMAPLSAWSQRLVALGITIGGIFFNAVVIGLMTDGVTESLALLRAGKGSAIISGHTLILGWSPQVVKPLLRELAEAFKSESGSKIAVLADEDCGAMIDTLDTVIAEAAAKGTEIIVFSGDPRVIKELKRVRVQTAARVCLLGDTDAGNTSDACMLRTLMAMRGIGNTLRLPDRVVLQLQVSSNEQLLELVLPGRADAVSTHVITGEMTAATMFQPGLLDVWRELTSFDGQELYIKNWPELAGSTFGEVLRRFPDAVPIAVIDGDSGELVVNPGNAMPMGPHDALVVIAEDDDTYQPAPASFATGTSFQLAAKKSKAVGPERLVICGFRKHTGMLLSLLCGRLSLAGSEIWIMAEASIVERNDEFEDAELNVSPPKRANKDGDDDEEWSQVLSIPATDDRPAQTVTIRHLIADPSERHAWTNWNGKRLPLRKFRAALVVDDEKYDTAIDSDTHSMQIVTLLYSFKIARDDVSMHVCCELVDAQTEELIDADHGLNAMADFVDLGDITAGVLAQFLMKRPAIQQIIADLIEGGTGGPDTSIELQEARSYIKGAEERISFDDMSARIREAACGILVGYWQRSVSVGGGRQASPMINPPDKHHKMSWGHGHMQVIVLTSADPGGLRKYV